MAFCDGFLLRYSVRDEVPRPKQAAVSRMSQPRSGRSCSTRRSNCLMGLAGPPHDRRRALPAFLSRRPSAVAADSATAYSSSAAFTTMRPMAAISSISSCTMS